VTALITGPPRLRGTEVSWLAFRSNIHRMWNARVGAATVFALAVCGALGADEFDAEEPHVIKWLIAGLASAWEI